MRFSDRRRDLRIPVIDRCLKSAGTRWSARQLLHEVNAYLLECDAKPVDIRSIQKDIKYLEGLPHNPAPIAFTDDGRVRYYYYADRHYELEATAVNADQLFALTLAQEVLVQLKGFPVVKEIESLRRLFEKQLASTKTSEPSILLFEAAPELKGIEWLEPLFEAIRAKTVIAIAYKPYGATKNYVKTIHPWWLKQSNKRWFLFGWDEQLQRIDNSPLDRIEKISALSIAYRGCTMEAAEYFKPIVGVTRPATATIEQLLIRLPDKRANYVLTKPLHDSQALKNQTEEFAIFEYQLIINDELISQLLSFTPDIEILEPAWLREKIYQILQQATKLHEVAPSL